MEIRTSGLGPNSPLYLYVKLTIGQSGPQFAFAMGNGPQLRSLENTEAAKGEARTWTVCTRD